MHPDDVRDLFACVDGTPRAGFEESLLAHLQSELVSVRHVGGEGADGSPRARNVLDLCSTPPSWDPREGSGRERRHRGRVVAAVAAAIAAIVAGVVIVTTDDVDLDNPPVEQPTITEPSEPPTALPEGLHALPPEGADPSLPVTGDLLAELPMPVWVYEDGRVISARWSGPDVPGDWSGFLEQRLTPEGVELVRSEIRASDPLQALCQAGGPGGYGFSDGGRIVCARAISGDWKTVSPRLYELPDGAPTWLPATAWADAITKPFVPASYAIQIEFDGETTREAVLSDLPPAVADVLARAPECAFDIFPPSHGERLCWKVTTDEARAIVDHEGFGAQYTRGVLMGPGWGYFFDIVPYLPHDKAVWCCGG